MIELRHTRAGLLAQIGASDRTSDLLTDLTDPRVATGNLRLRIRGHGREDLFPLLKIALSERYAKVPALELTRDLLMPLRNGLGNAEKHGNHGDRSKLVWVELVLTGKGALITLSDEGDGFDAAQTLRQFQEQENYFSGHGCGFRNLHRARSIVTYENGGRSLVLCFQPSIGDWPLAGRRLSAKTERGSQERSTKPLDPVWLMKSYLAATLPELADGQATIESCRRYINEGANRDFEHRYVVRIKCPNSGPSSTDTRVFTSRLHPTKASAAADFDAAIRLHEASFSKRLQIPRPIARLPGEPCLVLYQFDPWMSLRDYLAWRDSVRELRRCAKRIGRGLADLHQTSPGLARSESAPATDFLSRMVAFAEANLQGLPGGADLANRFKRVHSHLDQVSKWAASKRKGNAVQIHGKLGWDCIYYGTDGLFYLQYFEQCRVSHPGWDLGGFLADLLCFTLAHHDATAYGMCQEAFLEKYEEKSACPINQRELSFYIALAVLERLSHVTVESQPAPRYLLDALEAVITGTFSDRKTVVDWRRIPMSDSECRI